MHFNLRNNWWFDLNLTFSSDLYIYAAARHKNERNEFDSEKKIKILNYSNVNSKQSCRELVARLKIDVCVCVFVCLFVCLFACLFLHMCVSVDMSFCQSKVQRCFVVEIIMYERPSSLRQRAFKLATVQKSVN